MYGTTKDDPNKMAPFFHACEIKVRAAKILNVYVVHCAFCFIHRSSHSFQFSDYITMNNVLQFWGKGKARVL